MKVAIQGMMGFYHHQAAQRYYSQGVDTLEKARSRALVQSVRRGKVDVVSTEDQALQAELVILATPVDQAVVQIASYLARLPEKGALMDIGQHQAGFVLWAFQSSPAELSRSHRWYGVFGSFGNQKRSVCR